MFDPKRSKLSHRDNFHIAVVLLLMQVSFNLLLKVRWRMLLAIQAVRTRPAVVSAVKFLVVGDIEDTELELLAVFRRFFLKERLLLRLDCRVKVSLVLILFIDLVLDCPCRVSEIRLQLSIVVKGVHDLICDLLVLLICDVDHIFAVSAGQRLNLFVVHPMQVRGHLHLLVKVFSLLDLNSFFQVLSYEPQPALSNVASPLMPILGVLRVQVNEAGM